MFLKNKMLRLFKIISVLLANLRQNQHTRNNRSSPTRVFTLYNKTVWGKKAENTQKKLLIKNTTLRHNCQNWLFIRIHWSVASGRSCISSLINLNLCQYDNESLAQGSCGWKLCPALRIWAIVFADVRRGAAGLISPSTLALSHTDGINRYVYSHPFACREPREYWHVIRGLK